MKTSKDHCLCSLLLYLFFEISRKIRQKTLSFTHTKLQTSCFHSVKKKKKHTWPFILIKSLNYCNSSLLLSCRPKNIVPSYSCIHRIKMFKCSQPDRLRQPFLFSGAMSKLSWAVGAECINMFKTKELHSQNVHILHLPLVLQDLEDPNYML